jgi:hypothetical protein
MAAQLGNVKVETGLREQTGDFSTQSASRLLLLDDCIAQNVAHFFLHAVTVAFGAALKLSFDFVLNVADD